MEINAINPISFNAQMYVKKFYVPGKDNTTLRCLIKQTKGKTVGLQCDVLKKGKVQESKSYGNKKGFDDERLAQIATEMDKKVREGVSFIMELINAVGDRGI